MKTSHEKVWDFHHVHDLCTSKNWFCLNRSDLLTSKNLLLMLHMYQKKNVSIFTSTLTILKVTANFKYDMFMTFWHKFKFHTGLKILLLSKEPSWNYSCSELTSPKSPEGFKGDFEGPWSQDWVPFFHHAIKKEKSKLQGNYGPLWSIAASLFCRRRIKFRRDLI